MKKNMELYKDFYGCHAAIFKYNDGSVRLTIRDNKGRRLFDKEYTTYKGAKVAMGRKSDCWVRKQLD